MATKTFEELKQLAIQIRDEKMNKQNTATRIGTQMLEHLDKLEQDYYDKTATDEELKERDEKLTELCYDYNKKITNINNLRINKLDPQKAEIGKYLHSKNGEDIITSNKDRFITDYIPVSTNGLVTFGACGRNTGMAGYVVYDESYKILRIISEHTQGYNDGNENKYVYQPGDAFVIFCYFKENSDINPADYCVVEGTEYKYDIYDNIKDVVYGILPNLAKHDEYSKNLLDPSKAKIGYYISAATGVISNDNNKGRFITDYIPVNDRGLITNDVVSEGKGMAAYGVYNINKKLIRHCNTWDGNENKYVYQPGDAFVIFCYFKENSDINPADYCVVEGTEYKYAKYSTYKDEIEYLKIKKTYVNNVLNGYPNVYCDINDIVGYLTITEKNIDENYFIYEKQNDGTYSWAATKEFTPTGNGIIHIRGHAELTLHNSNGLAIYIANGITTQEKNKVIGRITENGNFDITVDTSYLVAHEDFDGYFRVWVNSGGFTTSDNVGSITAKISNWEVFEYINRVEGTNIKGENAEELFTSVDTSLSNIFDKILGNSNILVSPSGNKYILFVDDDGIISTTPIIPNKAAFFGNSLILGFDPYGMAASAPDKDYYYLITEYLKKINPKFVANPRKAASDFERISDIDVAESVIQTSIIDHLDGDEDLVVLQLGDNTNTEEYIKIFSQTSIMLLQKIRLKCKKARVIWMGMWYSNNAQSKYEAIRNACTKTGCEFISFDGLNTIDAQSYIGALTHRGLATRNIYGNVTNVQENSDNGETKNITVTLKSGDEFFYSTLDVISYSFDGINFIYKSEYEIVRNAGLATHPGDEGMRRISNRFLYKSNISDIEEIIN